MRKKNESKNLASNDLVSAKVIYNAIFTKSDFVSTKVIARCSNIEFSACTDRSTLFDTTR